MEKHWKVPGAPKRKINARLILASKNAATGDILYTWVLTYPYIIHGEVMTHRALSRNGASSRAVPMKRMRRMVLDDPFVPTSIGKNQKGMQAGDEQSAWRRALAIFAWKTLRYPAVFGNWVFEKLGIHKQLGNRFLMPWMWMEMLVSMTDVNNLMWLRDHKDAEPHFQILAGKMREEIESTRNTFEAFKLWDRVRLHTPNYGPTLQILQPGEWHLPFVDDEDWHVARTLRFNGARGSLVQITEIIKKISAARCARVSYYLPESGERSDLKRDLELFDRLAVRKNEPAREYRTGISNTLRYATPERIDTNPRHLSPLEHQAMATRDSSYIGNFRGWLQFRKQIPGERGGD
jgi:hypothetical protein